MGGCGSHLTEAERQSQKINREVDRLASLDHRKQAKKVRLLLLGPGESGKSTVFRQMQLLHGQYTDDDQRKMTPYVYANIISTMNIVIAQATAFGYAQDIKAQQACELLRDAHDTDIVDGRLAAAVKEAWGDAAVQRTWARRSEYQVVDGMSYFLNDIDRIAQPGYSASAQDMLHVRIRSSGIVVDRYNIDGREFEMYDVGGQRNERKKWIHCFDNVTAVLYVAALSEYDQRLFEDGSTNRMVEAITLFREICGSPYFERASVILFLNKKDLFEDKVKVRYIGDVDSFSDYTGSAGSSEDGVLYFLNKFRDEWGPAQTHYYHVTCATDTSNMFVVLTSCRDTILRHNLQDTGFIP